jgi:hypothetical protein
MISTTPTPPLPSSERPRASCREEINTSRALARIVGVKRVTRNKLLQLIQVDQILTKFKRKLTIRKPAVAHQRTVASSKPAPRAASRAAASRNPTSRVAGRVSPARKEANRPRRTDRDECWLLRFKFETLCHISVSID